VWLLVNAAVRAAAVVVRKLHGLMPASILFKQYWLLGREDARKLLTAAVQRDVSRAQDALQLQLFYSHSASGGPRAKCGGDVLKLLTEVCLDIWLAAVAEDIAAEHRSVQTALVGVSRAVQQDGQSGHAPDAA
jgi:hypothetical protein